MAEFLSVPKFVNQNPPCKQWGDVDAHQRASSLHLDDEADEEAICADTELFSPGIWNKQNLDQSAYLVVAVAKTNGADADQVPASLRSDAPKRAMDIVLSLTLAVFFAPIMALIALLLLTFDGTPILYSQERIGEGGRTFRILKFRTMRTDADAALKRMLTADSSLNGQWLENQKLARDPRVTRLGRLLRLSSLDELPQLFNILKGEMSLVGPRPIVASEAERYGRYFQYYCAVRPGLTGLWQVSGRSSTTYRRRVALDMTYSKRVSLILDLVILLKTVPAVFTTRGC